MKLFSLIMISAFAIGCGGTKPKTTDTAKTDTTDTTKTTDATKTGEGAPCAQDASLTCPDGQVDGCTKTPVEGDTHKCVAK